MVSMRSLTRRILPHATGALAQWTAMATSSPRAQDGAVPTVMWFRRDLRLGDNPALLDACDGAGVLPLFEGGAAPTGIPGGEDEDKNGPSRQKIFVDWTLCRGHGLCADLLPEVFQLGADGFPTVAQAQVPRYAEAKALRAVRRCPALALRIEESAPQPKAPSRNLPVLSQSRGRRALGR